MNIIARHHGLQLIIGYDPPIHCCLSFWD